MGALAGNGVGQWLRQRRGPSCLWRRSPVLVFPSIYVLATLYAILVLAPDLPSCRKMASVGEIMYRMQCGRIDVSVAFYRKYYRK